MVINGHYIMTQNNYAMSCEYGIMSTKINQRKQTVPLLLETITPIHYFKLCIDHLSAKCEGKGFGDIHVCVCCRSNIEN